MTRSLFNYPISIGIVGSRRRNAACDYLAVASAFFALYRPGDLVVSGGCPEGADRFAEALSACVGAQLVLHLPDKAALDPYLLSKNPRAAYAKINYARNTLIARDSDMLIACVASDRKGGTEDTIRKWKRFHKGGTLILV